MGKFRQEEKRTKEEKIGWHHGFNGDEFEQALDFFEGQRRLS